MILPVIFIIKKARKAKNKYPIDAALVETLDFVKEVVKNDPTKDLIVTICV